MILALLVVILGKSLNKWLSLVEQCAWLSHPEELL
jgi:hypothetical protein